MDSARQQYVIFFEEMKELKHFERVLPNEEFLPLGSTSCGIQRFDNNEVPSCLERICQNVKRE